MKKVACTTIITACTIISSSNVYPANNCPGTSQVIVDTITESSGARTVCSECVEKADKHERTFWYGKCEWDKGSRVELTFSSSDRDPFDSREGKTYTQKDITNGAIFEFNERKGWPSKKLLREGSFKCKVKDGFKTGYLSMFAYDAWNSGNVPKGYLEDFFNKVYINLYEKGICVPISGHHIDTNFVIKHSSTTSKALVNNEDKKTIKKVKPTPIETLRKKVFSDPEQDVSFKYTENFMVKHQSDNSYKFVPKDDINGDTYIKWEVQTRTFATNGYDHLKPVDYMKQFTRKIPGLPKADVISQKDVVIAGGIPGNQLTTKIKKNGRYIIRTILDANDHFYFLYYVSTINTHEKYEQTYKLMLNTLGSKNADSAPARTPPSKKITFSDPEYKGVSFKYSDSFQISPDGNNQYKLIPYDNRDSWIYWQIKSRERDYYGNKKLTAKKLMENYMRNRSENNVLFSGEVAYSGLQGYGYTVAMPIGSRHVSRVILDTGDYFIFVTLTTRISDYKKYKPYYEELLNSINVKGVNSHQKPIDHKHKSSKPIISKPVIKTPPKPIEKPKPISKNQKMVWYEDNDLHAKFLRPKHMQVQYKKDQTRFYDAKNSAYITYEPEAYKKDGGNYKNSKDMCKYLLKQMKKKFHAKSVRKIEKIRVGNLNGHKIHFTWKMKGQPLEQIEIGLNGPDKIYTLGMLATPESFTSYEPIFNKLLNSFRLEKAITKPQKRDNHHKKNHKKNRNKDESITIFVDSGSKTGRLSKDPVAVIFATEKRGSHTVRCNSMNKAPVIMILYDSDGNQIDTNFKNKQLYKGFTKKLKKNKNYFFFVAPLKDEDAGKTFEVEVTSE